MPPDLDQSAVVIERLREHAIDVLVLAGGDGTMELAHRFGQLRVACVGIPKTIDNDLMATDQTFGFDTAVNTATTAIDALHATAASHERVMILEVMGRYTGWIALHAGLAGGADVILIPEIPYELARVVAKIRERESHGLPFTIVVVAEGARPVGGELAELEAGTAAHLPRLGGAGERLMHDLAACDIEHEIRVTVLGHLQRGGTPTAFDRVLGTRMGTQAAEFCAASAFGQMVCLRGTATVATPIQDAVGRLKLVDPNGQLVAAARGVGIELGC